MYVRRVSCRVGHVTYVVRTLRVDDVETCKDLTGPHTQGVRTYAGRYAGLGMYVTYVRTYVQYSHYVAQFHGFSIMFPFFQGFSLISMIFISTYIRSGCKKFLSAPGLQGETFLSAPLKF